MLVFLKENLVFLSVPKTGTTAYAKALADRADIVITNPPELKHAPVYRYNRFFRPMFDKVCGQTPDLMAVIREPEDWLGSWYRYRTRDDLVGEKTSTRNVSFDEFVQAACSDNPPPFANVGSQAKFLEPRPNGTRITHLFQYEDQNGIRDFLETRLGGRIELTRENASPKADLALSAESRALLRSVRASEFNLWQSARRGD